MQNLWSIAGRSIALSTLTLALAACQSMRGLEPTAQPNIPNNYSTAAQNNAPSIATQGYKDFFADQRLVQVLDLAIANNRDLRTAILNIQKVQQQYQITDNSDLPTIGSNAQFSRSKSLGGSPTNVYSVGLGVTSYELDFWGRIKSLKDAALDNYLATQSASNAVQISLVSQVSQAWLNYSYATANLQLAQQTLKAQEDSYALNKKRFDVGIDSELPLRQAQISVETARNDVAKYKTLREQSQNAITLLVGQPVSEDLLPQQIVRQITKEKVLSTGLPSELLNNRPDVQQAQYQLSAAGANIGAAKARLFPSITLTSTAGLSSLELSDLFKSGAFVWSIAPRLDLPIFDWGTRQANIKISKTDQEIALASYEKSIQSAFREVNDALATRKNIGERLSAQRNLVQATNRTYQLAVARFRAGIDNYLTVLDAQRSSYTAQLGLLALEQTNLNNQIELYKTLGGGAKAFSTDVLPHPKSTAQQQ